MAVGISASQGWPLGGNHCGRATETGKRAPPSPRPSAATYPHVRPREAVIATDEAAGRPRQSSPHADSHRVCLRR